MPASSALSLWAVLMATVAFAAFRLGVARPAQQQPEGCDRDGAGCVAEDDSPTLLQVREHSAARAGANASQPTLPPEPVEAPPLEPAAAALPAVNTSPPAVDLPNPAVDPPVPKNNAWFYPRWPREYSALTPPPFDSFEGKCDKLQCPSQAGYFYTRGPLGCGECYCCHEGLIVAGPIYQGVFAHPEFAMKWCIDNEECNAFTIHNDSQDFYWFGKGKDGSKYRKTTYQGYMSCGIINSACAGRPYRLEGHSLAAKIPTAVAPERPGGWGATEPEAVGVGVATGKPAGLAVRLLAEATRSVVAVHEREEVEPLLALKGTALLQESELSELIRAARQELAGGDEPSGEERGRWRGDGLSEHASVGTFARLGIELMVAGAPPRLARLAARAQEEEVLHAHISLAVGGASEGGELLEFPEHDLKLARDYGKLRHAAIEEGLRGEGHAALKLFGQATEALAARRPALARLCWAMAQDEARHAQLAEETLDWLQHATGVAPPSVEISEGSVKVVVQ